MGVSNAVHEVNPSTSHRRRTTGPSVTTVGHDDVERPGVVPEDLLQKPQGTGDLVFSLPLRLQIDQERDPPPDQHGQDRSMIILEARARHLPFQTPRAAAQIGRGRFVAVEDQNRTVQGLVAFEPVINGMNGRAQAGLIQPGKDPADGVRTGKRGAQPAAPEGVALVLLQGVETAEPGHGHEKRAREHDPGRDPGSIPGVGQSG
jgi:hypothetical protein